MIPQKKIRLFVIILTGGICLGVIYFIITFFPDNKFKLSKKTTSSKSGEIKFYSHSCSNLKNPKSKSKPCGHSKRTLTGTIVMPPLPEKFKDIGPHLPVIDDKNTQIILKEIKTKIGNESAISKIVAEAFSPFSFSEQQYLKWFETIENKLIKEFGNYKNIYDLEIDMNDNTASEIRNLMRCKVRDEMHKKIRKIARPYMKKIMPVKMRCFLEKITEEGRPLPSENEMQMIRRHVRAKNCIKMQALISESIHPLLPDIVGPYVQKIIITIETKHLIHKYLKEKYPEKYRKQKTATEGSPEQVEGKTEDGRRRTGKRRRRTGERRRGTGDRRRKSGDTLWNSKNSQD
jgi:hypothetical protein